MVKLLIGSVLAGVVLMGWGFVTWGLVAGSLDIVRPVSSEIPFTESLSAAIPESGTYFLPWEGMEGTAEEKAAWGARHESGPIALLFVTREGASSNMTGMMIKGFVHFVLSALVVGLLVRKVAGGARSYGARVGVVTMAGVFGAFAMQLAPSIWWYVPWTYSLFNALATVTAWFLAGLVLAPFVKTAEV